MRIAGLARDQEGVLGDAREFMRNFGGAEHIIHSAGCDGIARHPSKTRGGFVLSKGDAAFCLDIAHAHAAIRRVTRKNYAYGPAPLNRCQRAEEDIDWKVKTGLSRSQPQSSVSELHTCIGRYDVH